MKPTLHVIVVEDSPDDALLMIREVERAGYAVETRRVETAEDLQDALGHGTWDLVLADYSLPHFSAPDALTILHESDRDVPFLVVSGNIGEEAAVDLMKNGAADYVMKDHLSRLGPAVQRELHDADERKRAEEKIQSLLKKAQADQELRDRLLNSMPDEVWYADATGHFTLANPGACKAFNLENTGDLDIQQFAQSLEVLRPDGSPRPVEEAPPLRALAGETVIGQEEIVRLPLSGELRYRQVNASPIRDSQGTITGCVSIVRDITERRNMEEALRQSESDLRQAQALAHAGSWRWDVIHDRLIWSDEMYRIYGIDPKTFRPSWNEVTTLAVHPEDWARIQEANKKLLEQHDAQPIEYRIVRPDGSIRTVWDQTGALTFDDQGKITSASGIVLDITERKKIAEERDALRQQLYQAQKLEAIGELAAGIAHDFNNLLAGILGNVDIMRSDLPASSPMVSNLHAIETAAHQAADLAKGLLTFGRKALVRSVPLVMAKAVDTALSIVQQSLPATIALVRDIEEPFWNVMADTSQITQVILNLAVNARDAMQGVGTLTIRLRNEQVGEEYARTHAFAHMGEFVHLTVADSGPGIPDTIREHLFEPFYTTKEQGTGLGLSIVYGAVKQAGGWVTADSPAGGGAVFDIFLPRCLEQLTAPAAPNMVTTDTTGGTVLVVEDEEIVRTVTAAMVNRSGYTALTAENGASALHVLQEHQGSVSLILLDMTMPGMTTQEIIPALRAIAPAIPIVLVSGFTSSGEIQRMLEDGTVQGFLGKPYPMSELIEMLERTLKKK